MLSDDVEFVLGMFRAVGVSLPVQGNVIRKKPMNQ
jgi:hypothetical protein